MTGDIPLYGDVNFGFDFIGCRIYIYILIYQELYSNLCETFDSQL